MSRCGPRGIGHPPATRRQWVLPRYDLRTGDQHGEPAATKVNRVLTAGRPATATPGRGERTDPKSAGKRAETSEEKLMSGKQTGGGEARILGRRTFLRYGALGGVAAAVTGAAGPRSAEPAPASPEPAPFELEEATLATLQERMQSGALTARALTE